jgi:uncharacterized repeat protein (TIGR02543 family)
MKQFLSLLWVLLVVFPCHAQIDGLYNVTETWTVTLVYDDWAGSFSGTRQYSGTTSGTISINNGSYRLIDRTGVGWDAPRRDSLLSRQINGFGTSYEIYGDYPFAPAYGSSAWGILFLGFFVVKVPLVDGEVPAFYSYEDFSANGPLEALRGGGYMRGSSLQATVSSTVKITRKPPESVLPTVGITSPASNSRFTTPTVFVQGTASDNAGVASVEYRIENSSGTTGYTPVTGTTSWSRILQLLPGANTIRVRARDINGNVSSEVSRTFYYDVTSPFTLNIVGKGSVTPNLNGSNLVIGKTYSMTAAGTSGYTFEGWTGAATGKTAKLTFAMKSNMNVRATFADRAKPTMAIAFPKNAQRLSNEVVVVRGTAKDNDLISAIWWQQAGGSWMRAEGTSNWTAGATLAAGPNQLRFFAEDANGNHSSTSSLSVTFVKTQLLNVSIQGSGKVQPNLNGKLLEVGKTVKLIASLPCPEPSIDLPGGKETCPGDRRSFNSRCPIRP